MIPTSARRLLLNLLLRPLLILWVQSDLALVHCPSINRNNPEGETNKQTSNTCASDKGKQTNCHTQRWRGSGCGKVWSDTWAELAYDSVEGSTYIIGTRTATVSRMLARTLERHGEIVDFQTGGPIMSTLLLIYMYWKSNGFYWGKPFHPAIGPLRVDIWSYPYDVIGSGMGPTRVCGG